MPRRCHTLVDLGWANPSIMAYPLCLLHRLFLCRIRDQWSVPITCGGSQATKHIRAGGCVGGGGGGMSVHECA